MCCEDGKWIASAESRSMRGASHQPILMGDCLTICHMYLPCLPGEWVSFCAPGAIAVSADAAWTCSKSGLGSTLPPKEYATLGDGQMVAGSGGSLFVKPYESRVRVGIG